MKDGPCENRDPKMIRFTVSRHSEVSLGWRGYKINRGGYVQMREYWPFRVLRALAAPQGRKD